MKTAQPHPVDTLSAFHQLMGLPKPAHPLISLVPFEEIHYPANAAPTALLNNFYSIALKRNFTGKLKYGQQAYDFDEGVMVFMAPGQVLSYETDVPLRHAGWLLMIHPDFLWQSPLARRLGLP